MAPKKYAVIIHDKDTDENGALIEPHVHAMLSFNNARSCSNIAKCLKDRPQYVEAWNGNKNNGYAYLVHATREAMNKFQYSPDQVIANFNYPQELQKITHEVEKSRKKISVEFLLDAMYEGKITKKEVEERLTGSQYARVRRQIEDISAKRLREQAEQWRKEMIAQDKRVEVIWIYGEAGSGKTSLAREYAEKANRPYYISGSTRDVFQNYAGEHTLILDEFRPNSLPYQDLLRITDPFGSQVMAPSRYNDKSLACDLIIITSPFNPLEFYRETFGINKGMPAYARNQSHIDSFDQLLRRITLTIIMNPYWVQAVEFDSKQCNYAPVSNASRKNSYSKLNRPAPVTVNTVDFFNSIFD